MEEGAQGGARSSPGGLIGRPTGDPPARSKDRTKEARLTGPVPDRTHAVTSRFRWALANRSSRLGGTQRTPRSPDPMEIVMTGSPRNHATFRPDFSPEAMVDKKKIIVFSKGLMEIWGTELATTLAYAGEEAGILACYVAMAKSPRAKTVRDGVAIIHKDEEFLVLELTEQEEDRLSSARELLVGAGAAKIMLCERPSMLIDEGILSQKEARDRIGETIYL